MKVLIGKRLKAYRIANGYTQESASKALGLSSKRNMVNWENDVNYPTVDLFLALCRLYHIDSFRAFSEEEKRDLTESGVITPFELGIIRKYRECKDYQSAINKLLDIVTE